MATPINLSQPSNLRSLTNKYNNPQLNGVLDTVSPEVRNALVSLDTQRVQRGAAPLTVNQSTLGALSANTGQQATSYQDNPGLLSQLNPARLLGKAVQDVGSIAGNIWRVPFQLGKEGEDIANGKFSQKLSEAKSPGDYLNLPGVRLIPGAQTLSEVLPGGLGAGQALEHPLMTALDVSPYAEAKIFGEAGEGGKLSTADLIKQSSPAQFVSATKDEAIESLAKTQPGRFVAQAFGPEARQVSSSVNRANYDVAKQANQMVQSGMNPDDLASMLDEVNVARKRIQPDPQASLFDPTGGTKTETTVKLQQYAGEVQKKVSTQLADTYGPRADQVRESLRAAGKSSDGIDNIINRDFIDPTKGQSYQGPLFDTFRDRGQLVPRNVADNLKRFAKPVAKGPLSVLDPIMGTFRTFVLPLSPRWHFNNILGGGLMVGLENPQAFRQLSRAYQLLQKGETQLKSGEKVTTADLPSSVERGQAAFTNKQLNHDQGMFMKTVTDKLVAEHPELVPHFAGVGAAAGKVSALGKYIVNKSLDFNGFFDDLYRTTAYLEGYDKSVTKGLSTAESIAEGQKLAAKVMPAWEEMTPLERGVMKNIFPFYGFTQKVIRNALTYPIDHPYRTAILNSFARAEESDRQSGLPDQLRDLFFLGNPDSKGNQFALSLGAANPYRDVGNFFTMAGFTSQLNPVAQEVLSRMGVDTRKAQPDLYADLAYNPETGRMEYKAKPIASSLLGDIIPQTKALGALVGANKEFEKLKYSSPSARQNYLLSSLGLPVVGKTVNKPQEIIKAEVQRETGQQQAISQSLKSGNLSGEIRKYPAGLATVKQIQALQPGALAQYEPTALPTAIDFFQNQQLAAMQ